MKKLDLQGLSDVLDVEPINQLAKPQSVQQFANTKPPAVLPAQTELEVDMAFARENLYQMINAGKSALEESLALASQSEHPRAFEVFGSLLKNLADVNKQLVEIQLAKRDAVAEKQQTQVNNTAVFVGSTSELAKLIRGGL